MSLFLSWRKKMFYDNNFVVPLTNNRCYENVLLSPDLIYMFIEF